MTPTERIAVVANPASANGRTGRNWEALERTIREAVGDVAMFATQHRGHGTELTRQALRDGYTRIIAVGGDGTYNEVVNGFFDNDVPINPDAVLSIIPAGTGSDLARALGIRDLDAAFAALTSTRRIAADVVRVTCTAPDGGKRTRYAIGVSHAGLGGVVAQRVDRTTKAFGGFASYLWSLLATVMTHRAIPMRLTVDGAPCNGNYLDLIIANSAYDGGGMHVAPQARLDSGHVEFLAIGAMGRLELLCNLPRLYNGTLEAHPKVKHLTPTRIEANADVPTPLNIDGDVWGQLPATFEVIPGAIQLAHG